jgi:hypothetical protein
MFHLGSVVETSGYVFGKHVEFKFYGADIVGLPLKHCFDELEAGFEDVLLV